MIGKLQDLATLGATVIGGYVALGGLRAWRRETIGKRDIELCQTVIERFYEAEHKLGILRSPMSYSEEGATRQREPTESDTEADRRNHLFVPLARFNSQFEFWSEFLSYKFRMKALFGNEAAEAFDIVDRAARSFRAAALTRYNALYRNPEGLNVETRDRFEKVIWEGLDDNDALAKAMKDAIAKMELICIPIVRSTSLRKQLAQIWLHGLAGI